MNDDLSVELQRILYKHISQESSQKIVSSALYPNAEVASEYAEEIARHKLGECVAESSRIGWVEEEEWSRQYGNVIRVVASVCLVDNLGTLQKDISDLMYKAYRKGVEHGLESC